MTKRNPPYRKQLLNSDNRKKYGCITTWEAPDGMTLTLHRTGPTLAAALRTAAAIALGEREDYQLAAYSTPETIYGDLIGARADYLKPSGYGGKTSWSQPAALPEQIVLANAGLSWRELLHPRLRRMTARESR